MGGVSLMLRRLVSRRATCIAARSSSITENLILSSSSAAAASYSTLALANDFHPALLNHSRHLSSPPSSDSKCVINPSASRLLSPVSGQIYPNVTTYKTNIDKEVGVELVEIDQRRLPADYDPANFDPTEHRSPPTDRVWRLIDEISGLTLVETVELSTIMMRELGMKDMPVVGVMKPGAAGVAMNIVAAAKEEKKPEKTAFELKIESSDAASKLKVIKEIRSFTDLGLKEAKDLVEKTPVVLKKGVTKDEAEKIIEKMKGVGAKVVMD